jgi:hypothetical protein
MNRMSHLLVALALAAAACGDSGPPFHHDGSPGEGDDGARPAPDDPESLQGPEGWRTVDLYGESTLKLAPGDCWTAQDCETGQACMHGEFFRTRSDTLGACMLRPPSAFGGLLAVSAVRFTDGGSSPATDDFVVEPGAFDVTFMADQDGWTQALDLPGLPLPIEPALGFEFYWQLGMYIRVVDPNDPGFDIECNVAFLRSGDVVGGVVRGPGKVLCSTNNWQPPQDPSAPGLLIQYELCALSETAWSGSEYCPSN